MTSCSNREYETFCLHWQGIDITMRHCARYLGLPTSHLEITAHNCTPLPITQTGYRSHFLNSDEVTEAGGPVAYVLAWLNHDAQLPEWQEAQQSARQYALF